ncbi:hypothetical protein F2Q69_00004772 [Brassica cretica]|uniref:Uncharacterized protein n=1 Tax=Brassica cretica TaxID=69181 RepID=A0A8S9PBD9_BRACR|nr:hypothetical protein F2Q69_00004772 [Brassica cretica]
MNESEIREELEKAASGHQSRMKKIFWVKELKMFDSKICFHRLHRPSVHNQSLLLLKKVKVIVKMRGLLEEMRETNPKRPRRQKKTQSQPSINAPDVTSSCPKASTIPSSSTATDAATWPPSTGRGRGRDRGRPPGRGQARREVVPRGHGVYISLFTDRVFEVYGDRSRVVGSASTE